MIDKLKKESAALSERLTESSTRIESLEKAKADADTETDTEETEIAEAGDSNDTDTEK